MEFEPQTEQDHSQSIDRLQVRSIFEPHQQAMLAALTVVLDLPRKPITLKEESETPVISNDSATCEGPTLAILPRKSDVCTLTARTQPEMMGQEYEGASGQEEKQWS